MPYATHDSLDMQKKFAGITVIGFDADDTLWVNEPYFQEIQRRFVALFEHFGSRESVEETMNRMLVRNIPLYGYGAKSFMLSLIETALDVSGNRVAAPEIARILHMGKELLARPVELLDGVRETLTALAEHYRLIVATKGDLLDQERKLENSGLLPYFHHIEIMSDKNPAGYRRLIRHLDIEAHEFLMIGNSIPSDILPVLEIGGFGIHIPYHTMWKHEVREAPHSHPAFFEAASIAELVPLLRGRS